jgi:hypothetical protein
MPREHERRGGTTAVAQIKDHLAFYKDRVDSIAEY